MLRSGKISWAPESLLDDSFMAYTSSEECEEVASAQAQLPPRPPSSRYENKLHPHLSFIIILKCPQCPGPETLASPPPPPRPLTCCPPPPPVATSAAPPWCPSPRRLRSVAIMWSLTPVYMCPNIVHQESLISRLRREIDGLKARLSSGERGWAQERRGLMAEISRMEQSRGEDRAEARLEDIRLERGRLALIEQRIKEILAVLKSLNSMVRILRLSLNSVRSLL